MNDQLLSLSFSPKPALHPAKSISQLNCEDFYLICKSQVKICKSNSYLQTKFKDSTNAYDSGSSFMESKKNEERVLKIIADRKARRETELHSPRPAGFKPNIQDCLNFLILNTDATKLMISTYEIDFCKRNFIKVLSSNSKCHEAYFGLARLASYEGRFMEALNYINTAISINPDPLYIKWLAILSLKCNSINYSQERTISAFCCFRPNHMNQEMLIAKLGSLPESIESLWCYMELSKLGCELEPAEYYAARIKDIDKYFGYLAWAELYLRNDSEKGVNLLKELIRVYQYRPEAYTKLWKFYYYNSKNYEFAEDIASEAFLRVTDYAYNDYYILFCLFCAKSYFKTGKIVPCLRLLQKKFFENYDFPVFLYHYGRLACKSELSNYVSQSIGAFQEFKRLCPNTSHGCANYWLAKAYLQIRQYDESYKYITKALATLPSTQIVKRENLRKWANELKPYITALKLADTLLMKKFDPQILEECLAIMESIKSYHKFSAAILNSKILWVSGNRLEAIEKLQTLCEQGGVRSSSYTLLFKYLKSENDFLLIEKYALEMISKCNFSSIPTKLWVTGNIWYAKALVKNGKPRKAILVLKSIAKIFTPLPYMKIPFTQTLQRANSIEELKDPSSLDYHVYDIYNHSFTLARNLSKKVLDSCDAPKPSSPTFGSRRQVKLQTEGVETYQKFFVFLNEEDDIDLPELVQSNREEGFSGICVYSNPKFLYLIGKYALKFQIEINDGICATKDYIEVLKNRKFNRKDLSSLGKAENVLKLLMGV